MSLLSFATLVFYELRRFEPLLEIRFFGSAPFSGASAIAVCAFAMLGGFLFLNTLYLQDVRGLSPLDAGLYMLPMAGATLVFAPISGRIVGRSGTRMPLLIASVALIVRLADADPDLGRHRARVPAGGLSVFGIGFGLINPPITNTAVSGMPPSQAGVAAAVASTSRQVGATLGVAIVGAVAGSGLSGVIGNGFASATHASWWIIVGLGVAILILSLLSTTEWASETAARTAARFREVGLPAPRAPSGVPAG